MKFTLKQLRYFESALRSGSIARAAEEMSISQSSITAAIDLIEQSIGVELFRRIPAKGIVATQTGEKVGARVATFLEQARVFESDLMSLSGDLSGTLRLGCYGPTASFVLPPVLRRLAAAHPGLRIDLREGDMRIMGEMLLAGKVDVALTYRRMVPEGLAFEPLFRAAPYALVPMSWPQARLASIQLADLAPLPMVLLDLHGTQTYFEAVFASQGRKPNIVHTTKSSSVLRALVQSELGYSIMNICGPTDRDGGAGAIAVPIRGELDSPLYGVAFSSALENSAIVRSVVSTAKQLAAEGGLDHLSLAI